uniref:Uncharacterized protein n=1 Tax=viral metagenome TaxID=1070528 RepID=A0A6C0CXW1_9ZZZZ
MSIFTKISNDINRVADDSNDEFKFLYSYNQCTNTDAMWGNNNGPQFQNIRSELSKDINAYYLPKMNTNCVSCNSLWGNSTSRKMIVRDY